MEGFMVICENKEDDGDRYCIGPYDSWDEAFVASASERTVQEDNGRTYANAVVPIRNDRENEEGEWAS